jgi:hypothetical protein
LQLQKGAVLWLMTAEASQPILQAYRDGIIRAARKADAAAPKRQRRGVDVSLAANLWYGIYMMPLVQPYRQLFACIHDFLPAVGMFDELEVVKVAKGKHHLVPKHPQPEQQQMQQTQQQQEIEGRPQHQTAATAIMLPGCGSEERAGSVFARLQEQQQQQHLSEEEGEWHGDQGEVMFGGSIKAELQSNSSDLEGHAPSAAAAAAVWVKAEPGSDAGDRADAAAVH